MTDPFSIENLLRLPPPTPPKTANEIIHDFHTLYYTNSKRTWENTFYNGIPIAKCPLDLWIYGEIIFETGPDLIIETGTWNGGSAHWLADHSDAEVYTIDINDPGDRPPHDGVTYDHASSTDPEVVKRVQILPGTRVMVILDSDHSADHVYDELNLWAEWVTPGCYLIVEDTNVSGGGNDAMRGLKNWLADPHHREMFETDREREKFFLTFNPDGYLRRR